MKKILCLVLLLIVGSLSFSRSTSLRHHGGGHGGHHVISVN